MASLPSTASSTPQPSRPVSPQYYHKSHQSAYQSDADSESLSPLIHGERLPVRRDGKRTSNSSWWSRRRRNRNGKYMGVFRKWCRRVTRHPLFPVRPISVIFSLILFGAFAISVALTIMYILNPDKEPLPWHAYCSIPSLAPPRDHPYPFHNVYPQLEPGELVPSFPPLDLETLPPAGIFIGIFTIDTSFERRMLIRSTWAGHPRSRNGAGRGDGGRGTSRTIVRFILGQPRPSLERRIRLEMETYNDIVILPMDENLNSGKTHTYYSWASLHAWVPPLYNASEPALPHFSYSDYTTPPPPLAPHDPAAARENAHSAMWIRPDYVIKADEDAFIMLAELEARLRVDLHKAPKSLSVTPRAMASFPTPLTDKDPLVYWGYLVANPKHQFMAGELYALSWSLVDWVAKDAAVKTMTKGAEDKQTAKWMRAHPKADKIRWMNERCWIYDHPRSGTVYAHGFLFPSEVTRVKRDMTAWLEHAKQDGVSKYPHEGRNHTANDEIWHYGPPPAALSHSTVSRFGVRYKPPVPNLSEKYSIEALVEGSEMSMLRKGNSMTAENAWHRRERRKTRYENKRVGGTVVIHYIKKHAWYMETALAMLEGEEELESEVH